MLVLIAADASLSGKFPTRPLPGHVTATNDYTQWMLQLFYRWTKYARRQRHLASLLLAGISLFCSSWSYGAEPLDYEREIVTLATSNRPFEISFFFEKTGSPRGGVILAYGRKPQPFYLNNIAYVLAKNGWSTALVGTSASDTIELDTQRALPKGKTETPEYAAILDRTIKFMQEEKGQYNLVMLAHGPIWDKINTYLSTPGGNKDIFQGLVMLNITRKGSLKELPVELPILDIATSRQPDRDFLQRKVEANRYKFASYTQVNLPSRLTLTSLKEDHLAKRIRGWLRLHIQGMELNKNLAEG